MSKCSYKSCFEPVFKDGFCETHYEHEQRIEATRLRIAAGLATHGTSRGVVNKVAGLQVDREKSAVDHSTHTETKSTDTTTCRQASGQSRLSRDRMSRAGQGSRSLQRVFGRIHSLAEVSATEQGVADDTHAPTTDGLRPAVLSRIEAASSSLTGGFRFDKERHRTLLFLYRPNIPYETTYSFGRSSQRQYPYRQLYRRYSPVGSTTKGI